MHICPFCHSKTDAPPPCFQLSVKQKQVYEFILAGGPEGVTVQSIMDELYPGKSYVSLRTALYYIRRSIAPIQIVSKGQRYSIQLMERKK